MTTPTRTEPTFHQRAATLIDTAIAGDSIVVASANGDHMVLQCRPGRAAHLVQIARAVLDQAADTVEHESGVESLRLARQIGEALECLPDLTADDDEEDDGC